MIWFADKIFAQSDSGNVLMCNIVFCAVLVYMWINTDFVFRNFLNFREMGTVN